MTAAAIIAQVRAAGADCVVTDGRAIIRNGSRLPRALVGAVRSNRAAIIAEIERSTSPVEQLPLLPKPAEPEPLSFWDREERRFFALLAEFGIEVPA